MINNLRSLTGILPQPVRFGLRKWLFSGDEAQCPLCMNKINRWESHGGGPKVLERRNVVGGKLRENDRCPICHGADRTRLLMLWLKKYSQIGIKPIKILHIAPEFGLYLWIMRYGNVDYTGSDLDKSRYRHIQNMVDADLTSLPFQSNCFDLIICSHVLEHVPDDITAMKNIYRVLKPGGKALLMIPESLDGGVPDENPNIVTADERRKYFGQWDHVRLYTPELFNKRLESSGFKVELFNAYEKYQNEAVSLHLNKNENLRVAHKQLDS